MEDLRKKMDGRIRESEIRMIMVENPWLSREDAERWHAEELKRNAEKAVTSCCPCFTRKPGVVRKPTSANGQDYTLARCDCYCHEPKDKTT